MKISYKWLIYVPLYASTALGGLAITAMMHRYEWDPLGWQTIVFGAGVIAFITALVMAPLLILQSILEDLYKDRNQKGG